jgi:hypothetical protein
MLQSGRLDLTARALQPEFLLRATRCESGGDGVGAFAACEEVRGVLWAVSWCVLVLPMGV